MRKEKPPPVRVKMLDSNGNLDPQWLRWFQRVGLFFDDYRRQADIVYTTGASLTTDDFAKVIRFDNGENHIECNLMNITDRDLGCWLTIFRTGTGRLTILPGVSSRVEYGSLGGRLWCHEPLRAAANVTLQVLTATQWAIVGSTGIWNVR